MDLNEFARIELSREDFTSMEGMGEHSLGVDLRLSQCSMYFIFDSWYAAILGRIRWPWRPWKFRNE